MVASGDTIHDGVVESQAGATLRVVKGIVVMDAFDASNDVRVWHEVARSESDLQSTDDARLQGIVRRMMLSFPDRSLRTAAPGH